MPISCCPLGLTSLIVSTAHVLVHQAASHGVMFCCLCPSCICHICIVHRASCIVHRASCIAHRASCIVHRASCIVHRARLESESRGSPGTRGPRAHHTGAAGLFVAVWCFVPRTDHGGLDGWTWGHGRSVWSQQAGTCVVSVCKCFIASSQAPSVSDRERQSRAGNGKSA